MTTERILGAVPARRALSACCAVLAVCLGVALMDGSGGGPDRRLFGLVIDHRGQLLIDLARSVVALGEFLPLLVIATVCSGSLLIRRVAPLRSAIPPAAMLVAGVMVWVLKWVLDRPGPAQVVRRVVEPNGSFPSGHAALSTAVLVAVGLVITVDAGVPAGVRRAVFAACALLAGAVSWSTVVLHMHWPSDAIGGCALGAAVAVGLCWLVDGGRERTVSGASVG